MDTVQVTLLIPIKNGEQYLATALANLEASARPNDEILIIDDNSEDFTFKVVEEWCALNPQFRLVRNPGYGLVDALNYGISEAKGNWIARYDVDDNYSKSRIPKQVELISHGVVAIFSDYSFRNPEGKYLGNIFSAIVPYATELSILSSQRLAHPVALIKKSAVISAGGYRKTEFPAEDLGLWLRMMEIGSFKSVPENLLDYSLSGTSISGSKRALMQETRDRLLDKLPQIDLSIQKLNPSVRSIFSIYRNNTFYWERTLFFLRDLLLANSKNLLNKKQKKAVVIASIITLSNPYTYILVIKHMYFKFLRAKIRSF